MSNGAVIKEGSVGRKFRPVDKLQINNQGGTNSLWRMVVEMDSKTITENGFYLAKKDSLYAYDEVVVNVTMLSEKEKKMGKTITGIDPTTGNPMSVGVDDDGNLTEEMMPDHIHIVIAPRKTNYTDGETLDFSGIHVYLMKADNTQFTSNAYPTGEIPFDELIFPVTVANMPWGETDITVSGVTIKAPVNAIYVNGGDTVCNYTREGVGTFPLTLNSNWVNPFRATSAKIGDNNYQVILAGSKHPTNYNGAGGFGCEWASYYPQLHTVTLQEKTAYGMVYIGESSETEHTTSVLPSSADQINAVDHFIWALVYGWDTSGGGSRNIPVQWMRSDGETLEDNFTITISSGEASGSSSSGGEHSGGDF